MINQLSRLLGGVLLTALILFGVELLAHFPSGQPPQQGVLRLAWRMAGERVKICHQQTQAELQALPVHMRRPEKCQSHLLTYELRVALDGNSVLVQQFAPPGAKGDRPLFVHQELPLAPGNHDLTVSFMPITKDVDWLDVFGELTPEEQTTLEASLAKAARVNYQGEAKIQAGRVALLEMDESTREFFLKEK